MSTFVPASILKISSSEDGPRAESVPYGFLFRRIDWGFQLSEENGPTFTFLSSPGRGRHEVIMSITENDDNRIIGKASVPSRGENDRDLVWACNLINSQIESRTKSRSESEARIKSRAIIEDSKQWQTVTPDWVEGFQFKYRLVNIDAFKPISIDEGELSIALDHVSLSVESPNRPHRPYQFTVDVEDGKIAGIIGLYPENPLIIEALVAMATQDMMAKQSGIIKPVEDREASRIMSYYPNGTDDGHYAVLVNHMRNIGHVWLEDPFRDRILLAVGDLQDNLEAAIGIDDMHAKFGGAWTTRVLTLLAEGKLQIEELKLEYLNAADTFAVRAFIEQRM